MFPEHPPEPTQPENPESLKKTYRTLKGALRVTLKFRVLCLGLRVWVSKVGYGGL